MERAATPDETTAHRRLAARGGGGRRDSAFPPPRSRSTSAFSGQPLACRLASRDELKAYANVLRELGKGAIEIALTQARRPGARRRISNCSTSCSTESARPVTWLAMASQPDKPEYAQETLQAARAADQARRRAAGPAQAVRGADRSAQPIQLRRHGDVEPGLQPAGRGAEADLRRPGVSRCLPQGADAAASVQRQMASRRGAGGRAIRRSRRWSARPSATSPPSAARDPLDTFLDLALEDDLNIQYTMAQYHEEGIGRLIRRSAHDARTFRRRRTRRHAVRRRLLHLPARQVGARAPGADAGARRQTHHVGAGRLLRHQAIADVCARTRRRRHDLRLRHRRIGQARARCSTICRAADGAW